MWNGNLMNGQMILTGLSIVRGEKLKELDREEEDLVELCWGKRGKFNLSQVDTYFTQKSVCLRFNGHFPGEPGLAGVYW